MRKFISLLVYWVIGFMVVFLGSYAFAQQTVELEGVIARIPSARILGWGTLPPKVERAATPGEEDGWEEQALTAGDRVRCPDDGDDTTENYVVIALNRSATSTITLEERAGPYTVQEVEGSSSDEGYLGEGVALVDLEGDSTFELGTPEATIGVIGTAFRVNVGGGRTFVEVLEGSVTVKDATTDAGETGISHSVGEGGTFAIIKDIVNPGHLSMFPAEISAKDAYKACKNACPKGKAGKECKRDCKTTHLWAIDRDDDD